MKKKTRIEMTRMHKLGMAAIAMAGLIACSTPSGSTAQDDGGSRAEGEKVTRYERPSTMNLDIVMRDQWQSALDKVKSQFNENESPKPKGFVIQLEGVLIPMLDVYQEIPEDGVMKNISKPTDLFSDRSLKMAPGAKELLMFLNEVGVQPLLVSSYGMEVLDATNEVMTREGFTPLPADFLISGMQNEEGENLAMLEERMDVIGFVLSDIQMLYPTISSEAGANEMTLSKELYDEFSSKLTIMPVGKFNFE